MKRLIILIFLLFFPLQVWAANCTVKDAGGDYTSLATALSTEGNGSYTITIGPYTGNERVTVTQSGTNVGSELIIVGTSTAITLNGIVISGDYVKVSTLTFDYNTNNAAVVEISIGADYNIVDSCIINNTNPGANETYGILFRTGSGSDYTSGPQYCTISNNTLNAITKHSMHIEGQGNVIESNTFANGINDAIRIFGKDNIIRSNEVYGFSGAGGGHADFVQTFGGISSYRYVNGIIIERNYVHDCTGMQIGNLEVRTDWNASNDISNFTFRNNIFADVFGQCNIYVPDVKFYNNIFYRSQNASMAIAFKDSEKGTATNGIVKNNMFMECGNDTPLSNNEGWYSVAAGCSATFTADYNYVCRDNYQTMDGAVFTEANGVNGGNPYLVAYGGATAASWALTSSSAILLNAGVAITGGDAFTNDYLGATRPQGAAWDIGPYEFTGSAAPSGTLVISGGIVESEVVTGGKDIVLTLTGTTWHANIGTDCAQTTALIAGIDSNKAEGTGWDAVVKAGLAFGDVTRNNDTVVTILLPAFAAYDITESETITVTIDSTCVASGTQIVASPTFIVSVDTLPDVSGVGAYIVAGGLGAILTTGGLAITSP